MIAGLRRAEGPDYDHDAKWRRVDAGGRIWPSFAEIFGEPAGARFIKVAFFFYEQVLGATVRYGDTDFAALVLNGVEFMLHADHTYDHHPLYTRLQGNGKRGTGAELRLMGIDPDILQKRAEAAGAIILQPVADFPHGWRDVILEDPDGYIWAVGVPLKK